MSLGQRHESAEPERGPDADHSRPAGFDRLAAEFERLRRLPAGERGAALAAVALGDAALATALAPLLAQHDDDPDQLATPAVWCQQPWVGEALAAQIESEGLPERIGAYRPIRELGRGGMGSVFLAVRDGADFEQQVAIKVLRALPGDRDLVRRFANERRILAALRHPNIAALVDGGTTAAGLSYVVMEYVEGRDLITHCRERQFGVERRLRLFVKVCRAVAHAHRGLVVHRDLKPGNILVTDGDEPKLLDFGIAKLLDHDEQGGGDALTGTGHLLLTPEYSSPEQVRGEAITTATDVYALGVVLYELLSGERAQPLATRSLEALRTVICERTPPPPSAAVRAGAVPGRVARRLRGDLDTIVAMAMRKEPERRYHSAAALADDLQRHLDRLPVQARAETFGYRGVMFVRRHRAAVAAALVVVIVLVAFAVRTVTQNRQIRAERDFAAGQRQIAERQRDEAERQRLVADTTAGFLVELFEMAAPHQQRAEGARARELLDRGARRIADRFATEPLRRANLELAMGRAYLAIGGFAEALRLLDAAHAAVAAVEADGALHRRTQFWLGVARANCGELDVGIAGMQAALAPLANGEPVPAAELRLRHVALADWVREAGRYDEALVLLERAAQYPLQPEDVDAAALADLRLGRAVVLRESGRAEASLALLKEVAAADRGLDDDGGMITLHRELSRTCRNLDRLEEAQDHLAKALELSRRHSGDAHPDVDAALFELAQLAEDAGDYRESERLLREVLARDLRRFSADHATVALDQAQLAKVLGLLERHDEAEPLFQTALAVQRRVLPPGHPELPTTIGNYAVYLHRNRRFAEAAPLLAEQLTMCRNLHGDEHVETLSVRHNLGVLRLDQGDLVGAEQELRALLEVRRRVRGEHSETAVTWMALATVLSRQQRQEEAVEAFVGARDLFMTTLGPDHPSVGRARVGLGIARMRMRQPQAAEPEFRAAGVIAAMTFGEDHSEWTYTQHWLSRSLIEQQQYDAALPVAAQAFARLEAMRGDVRQAGWLRDTLVELYTRRGEADQVAAVRQRVW
ncbi:MAG: serine/threonine protein kinase [Planctomycetes bacterium]|nr:serine/threonine protein kinase [Planctomycetota bacterium]